MSTNLKRYGQAILLMIIGVVIGALAFSSEKQDEHQNDRDVQVKNETVWTCSMHPQIRQEDEGDCPICGMDLIPASQVSSDIDPEAIKMSKTARALAKVETIVAGKTEYQNNSLRLSGQLKVNQDKLETLSANYDGRIERLYVNDEGEQVSKGQVIAEIYSPGLQILKDEYNLAKKQGNSTLINSIATKIKNLELTPEAIENIENGLLKLRSKRTGFVTDLYVNQGDNIKTDQKLLRIADLSSLWASLDIYESALNSVKVGDVLTLNIPDSNEIESKVIFVSPVLDESTRSAKVRAVIDNSELNLKPGVFISAELSASSSETLSNSQTLSLPKSAVLWTGKRSVVYEQIENESGLYFKMKEVSTGKTTQDRVEILSGISVGDVIVTHGAFSIDSEAQLSDKPSMMNRMSSDSSQKPTARNLDNPYVKQYLNLKNALVNDDFEKAISIVTKFNKFLRKDTNQEKITAKLAPILNKMNNSTDIEKLRQDFMELSEAMITFSKSSDIGPVLYVQYCPMADSNKGASWLSLEEAIRNPYYGASMLKCGEVKESL
jgi:Cu(I)/Ag(I) efflux system membrane fusion protein